jgi:hypothetical protein
MLSDNYLMAWPRTLPRLGSRVRIPSPAPKLHKSQNVMRLNRQGAILTILGEAGGKQMAGNCAPSEVFEACRIEIARRCADAAP